MKKWLLCLSICTALVFSFHGPAKATLTNLGIGGDRIVYDSLNNLYWYPYLTEFTDMTRAQQEAKIASLDYAGSSQWRMATWTETSVLKVSLAEMATVNNFPTSFTDFGNPISTNPEIGTPWLAWNIDSAKFFTPTGQFDMAFVGDAGVGHMADVFNGRTTGWGMTNIGEGGFWGEVKWTYNDADDHWVSHNIMNEGDVKLTITYNFDQHRLPDNATMNSMMGPVGAWVVASPVPEPSTILLLGIGFISLAGYGRKKFK